MTDPNETPDYRGTLFLPKTDFPMRAGLPKAEPGHLARWAAEDVEGARAKRDADRPDFILHDGPPYANGHIHMGTAANKILKDLVVRSRRMAGFRAPYTPGWDCHGLPIEWKVEEAYRAKGKRKEDVDPVEFRRECRAFAAKWIDVQREEFKRLGVVGTWENPYLTMDYASEATIVEELLKVAAKGLVYQGSTPVMWSPVEETALAEAEVEYHDHVSPTVYVKFPVAAYTGDSKTDVFSRPNTFVVIWTTTPWTIPANQLIAYGEGLSYGLYEVIGRPEECWARIGDRYLLADALAPAVFRQARLNEEGGDRLDERMVRRLCDVSAQELAALVCAHPLRGAAGADGAYDYDVPLHAGDFVTNEQGTGFVHCAPGHGADDYVLWRSKNPDAQVPHTVGPNGAYYDHVALFGGMEIIRTEGKKKGRFGPANDAVIEKLIEAGNLLARGRLDHSYPHSWRSKAPVLFRNTPQWFIRLDQRFEAGGKTKTLRERALDEIDRVDFLPKRGRARIRSMVEGRPDWLISRQRAWGVPITLFVHKETGEVLRDEAVDARIIAAVREEGADAWWSRDPQSFLGDAYKAADYDQVTDILDVWFDSGSTHAFTLEARDDQRWPADVYLEGSDQHRGWFQSSLLEACATRGRAPYDAVVTHGFLVDGKGRKMSKSLGNGVDPKDLIEKYGADIVRLWTASVDFTEDMRLSDESVATAVDAYRKIRNTLRYLLGALHGFGEAERLDHADMPELERYVLHRLAETDAAVRDAYAAYDFKRAFAVLFAFCNRELSALHFDVRKDSLYCDRHDAPRRRAARTVMAECLDRLTRLFAPILPFTMEEVWGLSPLRKEAGSVQMVDFAQQPQGWRDQALAETWSKVLAVRSAVLQPLEQRRAEKAIGASLEAAVTLWPADEAARTAMQKFDPRDLADLFIVSEARVDEAAAAQREGDLSTGSYTGAFSLPGDTVGFAADVSVAIRRASGVKCARSWKYFDPETADARHPHITPRDADAVEWLKSQGLIAA